MAVNLSPIGGVAAQFLDNSGNPLTGGKIFTYAAGTTTPQATYTSAGGGTPHANPIILDAAGRVPGGEIWLTDGLQYKFVIQTSNNVLIGTYDNIIGINSNFVNYTNAQEIQTATAGQTVFTLTTMQYQPGTNSLSVFVDGVNQYGPGAMYAYQETSSTVVTFTAGLHVGAQVKFVTSAINASSYGDAEQISYTAPYTGSATTNVEAKLAQYLSVKDFGAVGNGITDDTAAIQAALNSGFEGDILLTDSVISTALTLYSKQVLRGGKLIAATGSFINAINLHNVSDCAIVGVEITGNFDTAVRIRNCNRIKVQDCYIHDIGNTSPEYGFGVYVGDYSAPLEFSSDIQITGNTIKNISGNGNVRGDGVLLAYCSEVLVDANVIDTVNRMGVAVVSNAYNINITNNDILNVALAGVDCEPDNPLPTCYAVNISNNRITNYARSGFTGVGVQFFAVDVHTDAHSVIVSENIITPGANATQIFHCQNGAYDIQFLGNKVLSGGSPGLFLKTYAGNGTSKIVVANNHCLAGNVDSFIDAFATTNINVTNNQFAGSGAANSYFIRVVDVQNAVVAGNTVSNVTNVASSGIGDCSDLVFCSNVSTTLDRGYDLRGQTTGLENLVITGNTIVTPAGNEGIYIQLVSGYVRNIDVSGNVIPASTVKIFVTTGATGLPIAMYNTRAAVAVPVAGQVIYELSTNKVIQYLSGAWVAPA